VSTTCFIDCCCSGKGAFEHRYCIAPEV
jgi:hypothetical protein